MKTCVSCGQSINDDSIFCPFCGAKNEVMTNQEADVQNTAPVQPAYTAPVQNTAPVQPVYTAPAQPQQPYYATANANLQAWKAKNDQPMTIGGWMLTLLVMSIPVVNIIMLFVWAFGDGNTSRKNLCRAQLIYALISVILVLIAVVLIASMGVAATSGMTRYY